MFSMLFHQVPVVAHNVTLMFSRLFHQVTVNPATWSPTYTRFAALLDNYQPISRMEEEQSFSKTTEIDSFLDAIIRTDVCRYLEDFLMRKGIVPIQIIQGAALKVEPGKSFESSETSLSQENLSR